MLNKDVETIMYTSNCIKDRPFMFIARACDQIVTKVQIVIMPITEEQEKLLDKGETLIANCLGQEFIINPDYCYAYGELDLSPDSDVIKKIYKEKWFDGLEINKYLLSEYDYENHTVTSDIRGGRWYESRDPRQYLPYLYACINKPKRSVIFKEYLNISTLQKKTKTSKSKEQNKEAIKAKNKVRLEVKRQNKVSGLTFTIKK